MTTEKKQAVSDATFDNAGGTSEENEPNTISNEKGDAQTTQNDTVKYDTYRKVLGEKKKMQQRLEELEAKQRDHEEKSLIEQNKYKEAYEATKKELEDQKIKLKTLEQQEVDGKKLQSFLETIDGKIESKYWGHISLDKIIVDDTTGEIDKMSVMREVEFVRSTYPEIIQRKSSGTLPKDNPSNNGSGMIARSEWNKLKPTEMQKYRPDQIIWDQ